MHVCTFSYKLSMISMNPLLHVWNSSSFGKIIKFQVVLWCLIMFWVVWYKKNSCTTFMNIHHVLSWNCEFLTNPWAMILWNDPKFFMFYKFTMLSQVLGPKRCVLKVEIRVWSLKVQSGNSRICIYTRAWEFTLERPLWVRALHSSNQKSARAWIASSQ